MSESDLSDWADRRDKKESSERFVQAVYEAIKIIPDDEIPMKNTEYLMDFDSVAVMIKVSIN
jgi:hypothetical protein